MQLRQSQTINEGTGLTNVAIPLTYVLCRGLIIEEVWRTLWSQRHPREIYLDMTF